MSRRAAAVLALSLAPAALLPALAAEGSLFARAGPTVPVEGLPAGSVPEWTGELLFSLRVSAVGTSAELGIETLTAHDVPARTDTLYIEEAWAAWKPFDGLSLRVGRQRIGFGCGFAWSVVDDLDPQPMPFDAHLPREGLDAARISADFAPLGAPIQASGEVFAPRAEAGGTFSRLQDCGAAAQLQAFLGGIELGAAATIRQLGPDPPVSAGGWATADLAGFVLGAEGAWRPEGAQFLLNCNRRLGDFAALVEARWVPDSERLWLFGQASWSRAELAAALSALFSVRESSGIIDLALSYAASESLVLSADAALYEKPGELPEIGPLPWRYAITIGVEYFF